MTKKNVCRQTLVIMTGAIALGLAMLATGCGKLQTNPTADFGDVAKSAIPMEQQKQKRDRSYLGLVFPAPDTNGAILNFYEGESKSYVINFRLLMDNVDYAIQADGLPEGATLTRSTTGQPGDYILAWNPKVGTTAGEPMKNITVKIRLAVIKTYTTEAARVMNDITKEHKLVLTVVGSKEIPVIEKIDMPTDITNQSAPGETAVTIQKGGSVAFSVIIKDTSVADGRSPQLYATEEINGMQERPLVKEACQHVEVDRVGKSLGNGRYQFSGRFSSEGIEVKGGKQIAARFALVPVSTRRGADKVIEIDIVDPSAPAPVVEKKPAQAATPQSGAPAVAVPKVAPVPNTASAPNVASAPALAQPAPVLVKEHKLTKREKIVAAKKAALEKKKAAAAAKKAAKDAKSSPKSVAAPSLPPAPVTASAPAPAQTNSDKPVQTSATGDKT